MMGNECRCDYALVHCLGDTDRCLEVFLPFLTTAGFLTAGVINVRAV